MVDDEKPIIEIMVRALAKQGHHAAGADGVEAAAAALSASPYDLVLLDHVLQGTTGMQALPRLSALTKAPIYIMSGYTGDDTRKDVLLLGAAGFLPKPIDLVELYAVIDALAEKP